MGDKIAKEVFYILLNLDLIYTNQSGVEPVESLDDLPESDSDKLSTLSDKQRKKLVDMLLSHGDLTLSQQKIWKNYAESRNINQNYSSSAESTSEQSVFESRIDGYDQYMIAVDTVRLLEPAANRLDIPEENEESELLAELEDAKERKNKLYQECKDHPKTLREYRDEMGPPSGTEVIDRSQLNETRLAVPTGDGETIRVSYNIPAENHDIAVPENWDISPIRSKNTTNRDEICFENLPEDTQNRLLDQARREVLSQVVEFLDDL